MLRRYLSQKEVEATKDLQARLAERERQQAVAAEYRGCSQKVIRDAVGYLLQLGANLPGMEYILTDQQSALLHTGYYDRPCVLIRYGHEHQLNEYTRIYMYRSGYTIEYFERLEYVEGHRTFFDHREVNSGTVLRQG